MSQRKNFMFDDEAAQLLAEHSDDNHSEIIRELVKEYYTVGVYDETEAAARVRRRRLERQRAELTDELEALESELGELEDLEAENETTSVEQIVSDLNITDPEKATPSNPAIQKKAERNGVDPAVLAEAAKEQAVENRSDGLNYTLA